MICYANRLYPSKWLNHTTTFVGLGYALPGVVVAIGVLIFLVLSTDSSLVSLLLSELLIAKCYPGPWWLWFLLSGTIPNRGDRESNRGLSMSEY